MGVDETTEDDQRPSHDVAEASQDEVDAAIAQLEDREPESDIIIS
ncbi:hypothetical protein [Natronosalvus amylolyticus]|nr:hypothetical protein [Natronosalvus amylolyticus]